MKIGRHDGNIINIQNAINVRPGFKRKISKEKCRK